MRDSKTSIGTVMSSTELTQMAALKQAIDTILERFPYCFVVATSTRPALELDPGLLLRHRLGGVVFALQALDAKERAELLRRLLNGVLITDLQSTIQKNIQNIGGDPISRDDAIKNIAASCQVLSQIMK